MTEQMPEAYLAWMALCPVCHSEITVEFFGGAALLSCYNHDKPWYGHASIPVKRVVVRDENSGSPVRAIERAGGGQDAQDGEWHDLWSHHQAQCNCTDGNHSEAHHMNAARLNALTARVKELEQELDRLRTPDYTCTVMCEVADLGGICRCSQLTNELPAAEARVQRLEQALREIVADLEAHHWPDHPSLVIARAALEEATDE